MRTHGTLIRWNDERGFGFIQPAGAMEELFVHVSAFPHDGVRPSVDELVSFEIDSRTDGKRRAVRVMRPGGASRSRHVRRDSHTQRRPSPRSTTARSSLLSLIGVVAMLALGMYGYSRTHPKAPSPPTDSGVTPASVDEGAVRPLPARPAAAHLTIARAAPMPPAQSFSCDGRSMCSQMTSCAEATWFLNHCPTVKMDGDHDGVPCERQWCGATYADEP